MHTDFPSYQPKEFKPFRLTLLFLKAIRLCYPEYRLWRNFAYEYEAERLAFDVINGGTFIREWVDDSGADDQDLEYMLADDERQWSEIARSHWLY